MGRGKWHTNKPNIECAFVRILHIYIYIYIRRNLADGQALTKPSDERRSGIKVLKPRHAWTFVIRSLYTNVYIMVCLLTAKLLLLVQLADTCC